MDSITLIVIVMALILFLLIGIFIAFVLQTKTIHKWDKQINNFDGWIVDEDAIAGFEDDWNKPLDKIAYRRVRAGYIDKIKRA